MYNLKWIVNAYDEPIDIATREWLGDDYYYRTLVTSVNEAERFNYHSDYWGNANDYQYDNVQLMIELEPYVGTRCYIDDDEFGYLEGTLEGILIDTQYNNIGHTCILLSDISDEKTAKTYKRNKKAMKKKAYDKHDEDVQFLFELMDVLLDAGYDVYTFEDGGLLTNNLGLVINGNQFSWLGSYAG